MRFVRASGRPLLGSPPGQLLGLVPGWPQAAWFGYAFGLVAVALVTGVLAPLLARVPLENASTLYGIAVLGTAALYGRGPALATSAAAFLAFDYFYVEPAFALTLRRPQEWVTLAVFLVTALVAGQLAAALRQRAEDAQQREREALATGLHPRSAKDDR
jgi:two-component system, OmpR family, sensor histidine kinase KdpD